MSLLKPHGSLDWAQCPECGQLVLLCHHQPFDVYRRLPYSACGVGERMHPVIQMPHQGSLPVLGDVLRRTERAVHAANHIVVIGYSFPEYDMHTRGLFRQALRVGATRWRSPHQTGWFRGVSTGDPAGIGRGGGYAQGGSIVLTVRPSPTPVGPVARTSRPARSQSPPRRFRGRVSPMSMESVAYHPFRRESAGACQSLMAAGGGRPKEHAVGGGA